MTALRLDGRASAGLGRQRADGVPAEVGPQKTADLRIGGKVNCGLHLQAGRKAAINSVFPGDIVFNAGCSPVLITKTG
jgi:hypothetical protein